MFKGPKPAAQPRSLRSIAESNESKNFGQPFQVDQQIAEDPADALKSSTPKQRGTSSGDKSPFANIKKV